MTHHYPMIHGGSCEICGTIDPLQPAVVQYLLCDHFKEVGQIRCSYCPDNKDQNEVIRISNMQVMDNPDDMRLPSAQRRVIVKCDSFECSDKHLKRFKVSL